MKRNQFEFFPDNDPEFDKALAEAVAKCEQSAVLKKKRSLSPDIPEYIPEFIPSGPLEKPRDERNYDREIQRLETTIEKLKAKIKSLKEKKRNKTEDNELKLTEARLKRCEDDLYFTTNARNFSASNN
jgi:hypothetical protein